jgi:hypothetical protein
LGACGESQSFTAPSQHRPRFNWETADCQFDSQTCGHIWEGIQFLRRHWAEDCRRWGDMAEARFLAPTGFGYGFQPGNTEPGQMAVPMHETPGATTSGWSPSSGYIQVGQSYVGGNEVSTGGLIAHEEGGHMTGDDSPEHNTGIGNYYQDLCMTPLPG